MTIFKVFPINNLKLGSRPHIIKFQTKRIGNPLCPEYRLPFTEHKPISPTKLIKENKFANEKKELTRL